MHAQGSAELSSSARENVSPSKLMLRTHNNTNTNNASTTTTTTTWKQQGPPLPPPHARDDKVFYISDAGAFRAASRAIVHTLRTQGSITSSQCNHVFHETQRYLERVNECFPYSFSGTQVLQKVQRTMQNRAWDPTKMQFAKSTCPDEANDDDNDDDDEDNNAVDGTGHKKSLAGLFQSLLHRDEDNPVPPLQLGGFAGVPFMAKSKLNDFLNTHLNSNNNNDDNNKEHCLLLLATHVAMDSQGRVGRCDAVTTRNNGVGGKNGSSSSPPARADKVCAAANTAFTFYTTSHHHHHQHSHKGDGSNNTGGPQKDPEQEFVIRELGKVRDALFQQTTKSGQQVELAKNIHEISQLMLEEAHREGHGEFGSDKSVLLVLSGISINMPGPFEDYFQPLALYALDSKNGTLTDLFKETFGHTSLRAPTFHGNKPHKSGGFFGLFQS